MKPSGGIERRQFILSSLAAVVGGRMLGEARPIVLAQGGKSGYSICVARDCSPSERRGAEELQRFIGQMSDARLPIATDAEKPAGNLILVGNSRKLEQLRLEIPFDELGPEGFALKTAGPHLVIAGGWQRGTMYGVYTFLERLGCRWFAHDVSRIPRMKTITVQPLAETHKPAFEYRDVCFNEAQDKDWAARNKINGQSAELDESTGGRVSYFPFVHSFNQIISPEKYFAQHPEYFALVAGSRQAERAQLCLSNPEVLKIATETVLRWIEQHPEVTIVSVSQNDCEGWCECAYCRRIEEEEGGAHSGPVLRFVNAIAAEVEKKYPDKLIDTLAYWYTEPPPLKARPRRNVRVRLCPIAACHAHPYDQCDRNASFMKTLREWSSITHQLYVWHYGTNFANFLLPYPNFDELAANLSIYRRNGVVGVFLEQSHQSGVGPSESGDLRSYVAAHLLWDTNAVADKLIDEFLAGCYKRAAKPMRAHFDLMQSRVRRPPNGEGQHIWTYRSPRLSDGFLAQAADLFRQADAAADDEPVRQRVRKARLSIEYAEFLRARRFLLRDGWYAPSDLDDVKRRFDAVQAEARRFGLDGVHEGYGLKDDEREFATLIKAYPVVTLQNASLRVDVVPGLNGRIIRMVEKKLGKEALRHPDIEEYLYPNEGGLSVFVRADFDDETSWNITWQLDSVVGKRELLLTGACENGLQLRRRITLPNEAAALHTETTVKNAAGAPLRMVIESRAECKASEASVAFRKRTGGSVEMPLLPVFRRATTYVGSERPDGEWQLVMPGIGLELSNRFSNDQVDRCQLTWRSRGEDRIYLSLLSGVRTLAAGESLRLDADYAVSPGTKRF